MLYDDTGLSDRDVIQLAFGVSTGEIHYLLERYWSRVSNPNCLSPVEIATHIGNNLSMDDQDRLAAIAREAHEHGADEATVVLEALRGYLVEQRIFGSRRTTRLKADDRRFPKLKPAGSDGTGNHLRQ